MEPSLLRHCAVLLALRQCWGCGHPEVSETDGFCAICGTCAHSDVLQSLQAGVRAASKIQLCPLWQACSMLFWSSLPELDNLRVIYSLREQGAALTTLREETQKMKDTLIWVRTGCDRGNLEESRNPDYLGAFIPFQWPWHKQRSPTEDRSQMQRAYIFYIFIPEDGRPPQTTVFPFSASGMRSGDLMRVSLQNGLLLGGATPLTAAFSLASDLRHGRLSLPSTMFRYGFKGNGSSTSSQFQSWNFDVVDVEVWSPPLAQ